MKASVLLIVVLVAVSLDMIQGQEGFKEGQDTTDEARKDKPFWAARGRRSSCRPPPDDEETLDSPPHHRPPAESLEMWDRKLKENPVAKLLRQGSEEDGGEAQSVTRQQKSSLTGWKRSDPRALTLTKDLISFLAQQQQIKRKTQEPNTPFWPARG